MNIVLIIVYFAFIFIFHSDILLYNKNKKKEIMFWYARPQYQACKQKGNSQVAPPTQTDCEQLEAEASATDTKIETHV